MQNIVNETAMKSVLQPVLAALLALRVWRNDVARGSFGAQQALTVASESLFRLVLKLEVRRPMIADDELDGDLVADFQFGVCATDFE